MSAPGGVCSGGGLVLGGLVWVVSGPGGMVQGGCLLRGGLSGPEGESGPRGALLPGRRGEGEGWSGPGVVWAGGVWSRREWYPSMH